jgi:PhzF family phenazine biosynthesis protein
MIGIADITEPDYGTREEVGQIKIGNNEVPMFWACGVSVQDVLKKAKLPFAITHTPGYMFVADASISDLKSWVVPGVKWVANVPVPLGDPNPGSDAVIFVLPDGTGLSQKQLDAAWNTGGHNMDYLPAFKQEKLELSKAEYARCGGDAVLDMKYGERDTERIDFLPAVGCPSHAPTLLWIHGGGWQIVAPKEEHSTYLAASLRDKGINVAVLEYSSHSPNNLLISEQCRQAIAAIKFLKSKMKSGEIDANLDNLVVAGHSAGGHIAAVLAAHPESFGLISAAVSVAGVGELSQVKKSYLNEAWGVLPERGGSGCHLSDHEVDEWSPVRMLARMRGFGVTPPPLLVAVGGAELPELIRQSYEYLWEPWKKMVETVPDVLLLPGYRHFDVLNELQKKDGKILEAVVRMIFKDEKATAGAGLTNKDFWMYDSFTASSVGSGEKSGSPAAIIPVTEHVAEASGLSIEVMQRIALELGAPASCFVFGQKQGGDKITEGEPIDVRFFSTMTEYPLCGHGTLAIAKWLVESGRVSLPCKNLRIQTPLGGITDIKVSEDGIVMQSMETVNCRPYEPAADFWSALLNDDGTNAPDMMHHTLSTELTDGAFVHLIVPMKNLAAIQSVHPDFKRLGTCAFFNRIVFIRATRLCSA